MAVQKQRFKRYSGKLNKSMDSGIGIILECFVEGAGENPEKALKIFSQLLKTLQELNIFNANYNSLGEHIDKNGSAGPDILEMIRSEPELLSISQGLLEKFSCFSNHKAE